MLRSCKRQGYLLLKQVASQSGASSGRTAASCKSQLACRTVPETKLFSARTFGSHSRFGQHDPEIPTEVLVASLLFPLTQGTSLYWAGKRAFSTNNNTSGPDHPDREPPGQTAAASPGQEDFEVDEQPDSQPDSQQTLPAVPEDEAKYDLDAQDGPRQMSLQEYDAVLDRWGELLQEGKLDEILDLMEYAYGGYEPLPPLEEMLAGNQADEEKAERRAREKALQEDFARQRVQVIDDLGRSYATGKRKTSVARVWLKPGSGIISVNGKGFDHVFPTIERRQDVLAPLAITGTYGTYDVKATVRGGGVTGQAQALRHGIGKALQLYDPTLRPPLKTAGFLVRDARVVERKKPGRAKARKSFQWVKR